MTETTTAHLIDTLFKTHRKSNGQEYSYQEVSKALEGELDPSYIGKVRKGVIKNPGRDALLLLCRFFKIPASYFFPELEELAPSEEPPPEKQMEILHTAFRSRDPRVQEFLTQEIMHALRQQGRGEGEE